MERVLFLDCGTAARAAMAEAFLKLYGADYYEVYSAGMGPSGLHPLAVEAMGDIDIDIRAQTSTPLEAAAALIFDVVITLADEALAGLAMLSYGQHLHWPVENPALTEGSYAHQLTTFHEVRDILWDQVRQWVYERSHVAN